MNKASAIGTVWTLVALMLTFVSVTGLVVLGARRCWTSVRSSGQIAWRACGFLIGVGLLAVAVLVLGMWAGDALVRAGFVVFVVVGIAAVVLWAWAMWTDRAPFGELVPGRYRALPHRPAWLVAVCVPVVSWGLLWWSAERMGAQGELSEARVPSVAALINVWAVVLFGVCVVVAWVQAGMRQSWVATGRTRFQAGSWRSVPGIRRQITQPRRSRGAAAVRCAAALGFLAVCLALAWLLGAGAGAWPAAIVLTVGAGLGTVRLVGWALYTSVRLPAGRC